MATKQGISLGTYLPPEISPGSIERGYRLLQRAVIAILQGRINAIGTVDVAAGDSPLTVLDERCTAQSVVLIMIETSDLANNFTYWISEVGNGYFVFEFSHSGQMPTTSIRYLIQG